MPGLSRLLQEMRCLQTDCLTLRPAYCLSLQTTMEWPCPRLS